MKLPTIIYQAQEPVYQFIEAQCDRTLYIQDPQQSKVDDIAV